MSTDTTYQKNVDTSNCFQGNAVVALILAAAAQRDHTRNGLVSFQYDATRGVGVLVVDAGVRQHLANSLKFDSIVSEVRVNGMCLGYCRTGKIEGIDVTIWNLEP